MSYLGTKPKMSFHGGVLHGLRLPCVPSISESGYLIYRDTIYKRYDNAYRMHSGEPGEDVVYLHGELDED